MNSKSRKSCVVRFLTALLCLTMLSGFVLPFSAASRFVLGEYFTDHAVLQRDMPVRLTGTASPGKTVTAKLFLEKDGTLVAEASAGASGTLYMDDVILSGDKAEEPMPDVFTDGPETISGETDASGDTDLSGKTEKDDSVLVPVLIGVAAVFAVAAAAVVLLKNKKKSA